MAENISRKQNCNWPEIGGSEFPITGDSQAGPLQLPCRDVEVETQASDGLGEDDYRGSSSPQIL